MVDSVSYSNKLSACPYPQQKLAFSANPSPADKEQKPDTYEKDIKNNKLYPIKAAVAGGLIWGGISLGTDLLIRKFTKFDMYSKKMSFIISGLTSLVTGVFTYFNARKIQKNENINSYEDLVNSQTGSR